MQEQERQRLGKIAWRQEGATSRVQYRVGDISTISSGCILHGCNAQGVMNSGVAGLLRRKHPKIFEDYREVYEQRGLQLGEVIESRLNDGGLWILNGITQEHYGRDPDIQYASIGAIAEVVKRASEFAREMGYTCLSMPQIGCGLGNAKWQEVKEVIDRNCVDSVRPIIYVLKLSDAYRP